MRSFFGRWGGQESGRSKVMRGHFPRMEESKKACPRQKPTRGTTGAGKGNRILRQRRTQIRTFPLATLVYIQFPQNVPTSPLLGWCQGGKLGVESPLVFFEWPWPQWRGLSARSMKQLSFLTSHGSMSQRPSCLCVLRFQILLIPVFSPGSPCCCLQHWVCGS